MAAGAFKADFTVNSKTYRVLHASFSLQQDVDKTSRPSSEVRAGTIQLEVESSDDTNLLAWAMDDFKMYDGSVKFYKKDDGAGTLKTLSFNDGYCVAYTETFTNMGDNPMSIHIVIAARKISVGQAEFSNEWENLKA